MPLHDVTHNGKPHAKAALHSSCEFGRLAEGFEYVREEVRADTDAGVADGNMRPSWSVLQLHLDRSTLLCELDRI